MKYNGPKNQKKIFKASGEFTDNDLVVSLLYRLMRDEVTPGAVEEIVLQITDAHKPGEQIKYTNGWLAQYAKNIVERLNGSS